MTHLPISDAVAMVRDAADLEGPNFTVACIMTIPIKFYVAFQRDLTYVNKKLNRSTVQIKTHSQNARTFHYNHRGGQRVANHTRGVQYSPLISLT